MISKLIRRLDRWDRRVRRSFGKDIETPRGRLAALVHYHLYDHAVLRVFWTNFFKVAPGVYRSNQPTAARFRRYARMGIRTVLNLRGTDDQSYYLFEKETLDQLGLELVDIKLYARNTSHRDRLLAVIEAFRTMDKPFLMHCKSGADRTGLAAAMYLMVIEGKSVAEARRQLSVKYIHLKWTKTGILDYILDVYEDRAKRHPIGFEDWLRTEYHHDTIQSGFDAGRLIPPPA